MLIFVVKNVYVLEFNNCVCKFDKNNNKNLNKKMDFSAKKKISLMNILNNNGPNIEPCGIPQQISDHLLCEKPTLVLCFLKLI